MDIGIISFTEQGRQMAEQLRRTILEAEHAQHCQKENVQIYSNHEEIGKITLYEKPGEGVTAWAGRQFEERNALIFVGACGIAVRAIAPFVKDKLTDSPVLVVDELGSFVIPILSGHVGGANELAGKLADCLQATAVITTATDRNGKFAVDLFAKKNLLTIRNREGIARVSAKILRNQEVTVSVEGYGASDLSNCEKMVDALTFVPYPPKVPVDILISTDVHFVPQASLYLKPKEYVIGIGCRKGKEEEKIGRFLEEAFTKIGIAVTDIASIASIDQKKEEPGICGWAVHNHIPYRTFSAHQLRQVEGSFCGSDFVAQTVGVDNVCERAALLACGADGVLVLEKQIADGMTLAVAKRRWKIVWNGGDICHET